MRAAILVGSVREDSYSLRAAVLAESALKGLGVEVDLIDPRQIDLPLPGSRPSAMGTS